MLFPTLHKVMSLRYTKLNSDKKIFLLVYILAVILPYSLLSEIPLPVETKLVWEQDFVYIEPRDLNNNSIDELITIPDFSIQPYDQNFYSD